MKKINLYSILTSLKSINRFTDIFISDSFIDIAHCSNISSCEKYKSNNILIKTNKSA